MHLGVEELEEREDEVWGLCPGHVRRVSRRDKSPSWSMNVDPDHPSYGQHHCFSCGYGGHLYSLVAELKNWTYEFDGEEYLDRKRAKKWVFRQLGDVLLERAKSLPKWEERWRREERKRERPPMTEARLALFVHPPSRHLRARGITASVAEDYGVLWDARREAWILPIRRARGELIGWQLKSERMFRNFPKGVAKGECLFGAELVAGRPVVVLESPLDVCRLASVTDEYAGVATFGASYTDTQARMLTAQVDYRDRLVLAFDDDAAGQKAAAAWWLEWRRHWANLWFLDYGAAPGAKDVGDMDDEQVTAALAGAVSDFHAPLAVRKARAKIEKETARVHGKTAAVPARGRRADARAGPGARRL